MIDKTPKTKPIKKSMGITGIRSLGQGNARRHCLPSSDIGKAFSPSDSRRKK